MSQWSGHYLFAPGLPWLLVLIEKDGKWNCFVSAADYVECIRGITRHIQQTDIRIHQCLFKILPFLMSVDKDHWLPFSFSFKSCNILTLDVIKLRLVCQTEFGFEISIKSHKRRPTHLKSPKRSFPFYFFFTRLVVLCAFKIRLKVFVPRPLPSRHPERASPHFQRGPLRGVSNQLAE